MESHTASASPTASGAAGNTPGETMSTGFIIASAVVAALVISIAICACCFFSRRIAADSPATAKIKSEIRSESKETMLSRLETACPTKSCEEWWETMKAGMDSSSSIRNHFVCPICLEEVNPADNMHTMTCDHVFHAKCIEEWFLGCHLICPLCQRAFYPGKDATENAGSENAV
ncbi:hypothetical protein ASPWEDRAFT_41085 [Aspergillus wentii DTO 134E9]|uniref:RING-type domain-containing protein n=1 Tax=Aspergillus wentii DTO 134E9 TaxID=1073089 RepID=A0A1L9RLY8_ASPWE|nr:uncharacterized protein ASPWEDRAFT_41085 [Aspergillus wentii DTO 134E9]KAI9929699.1 hypothetical protein MW887_001175 [Aspergillus wentii]OJJ35847.1 hypothetical protein ASPWEDRAFT_41085 [Aspergillus wentii DTO 134E9]